MMVVTNRIRVQKGKGKDMAPRFTRSQALLAFAGFHKVEVLVAELDDCDEMSVNMYWDSMADFQVWRESDAFKAAHQRQQTTATEASPVISSQLIIAEVAAQLSQADTSA